VRSQTADALFLRFRHCARLTGRRQFHVTLTEFGATFHLQRLLEAQVQSGCPP
jgi:hypothetical protein